MKDLQDFYIDRGLFVVDDVMFKFDVLDDWLLSDELATIYLRNVAPDFNAAGALCRGENNEMVQQVGVVTPLGRLTKYIPSI